MRRKGTFARLWLGACMVLGLWGCSSGKVARDVTKTGEEKESKYITVSLEGRYEKMLFQDIEVWEDVVYSRGLENEVLELDIRAPKGDDDGQRPAVVFVHGGSLTSGDKANAGIVMSMSEEFAQMGYVTFNVNYRLGSEANQSALENAMEDVETSIKWIKEHAKEYGVDKERIILVGYSAGADIILNMCYADNCDKEVRKCVKGVVSLSGGGVYYGMTKEAVPPCMLLHGTNDTTVPYSRSEAFYNNLVKVNDSAILYPLEGLNHTLTTRYEEIRNQSAMFVYRQLTGKDVVIDIQSPVSVEYKSVLVRMENGIDYQVNAIELTLDGKLDEWNNAEKMQLNGLKDVGDDLPEREDFEGFAMVGWNPSEAGKLYLAAQITDDEIKNTVPADGKWYNDDCLEIIIDVSQGGNAEQLLKWVVGATGEDLSVLANESSAQCQVVRQGNITTYELVLDLNSLPTGTLKYLENVLLSPECEIGFNISYNDCENGKREHQTGWIPGVSNDRVNMGNLEFVNK